MDLDVDRAAPLFGGCVGEMDLRDQRAGAPQHGVDAPVRGDGARDGRGQCGVIGDVALMQARLAPRRLDTLGQRLGLRLFRAPCDRDVAPRRREFTGNRRADATGRTENQRRALGKLRTFTHLHPP